MRKIIAGVTLSLGAAILCYLFLASKYGIGDSLIVSSQPTDNTSVSKRLDDLEVSVEFLTQRVTGEKNPNFLEDKKSVESRLSALEREVASLSGMSLPNNTAPATPLPGSPPSYIPLGWQASSGSLTWTVINSQQFIIDSGDYPTMTSAQFQVEMRVFEGNGTAFATLYDALNNLTLWSAQVSTSSQDYTWVYSPTFSLPGGKHTYELELKSLTGYSADVEDARMKINF